MREAREGGREEGKRGRRRMTQSTEEGVVIAFLEWKKNLPQQPFQVLLHTSKLDGGDLPHCIILGVYNNVM